jgi:hypothetical protein
LVQYTSHRRAERISSVGFKLFIVVIMAFNS